MSENRHLIWSNYDLDYEDWKDELEAEYPEKNEHERMEQMYEINGDYLDDERCNLNIPLSQPILVIADLGRCTGNEHGLTLRAVGDTAAIAGQALYLQSENLIFL